jgi:hypothetical protein
MDRAARESFLITLERKDDGKEVIVLKLKCIEETEGFTVGKTYKLLGCAGECVQLKDDNKESVILFEGYFELVK